MNDNNDILIYSKNKCPYCVKAKNLLTSLNIEFIHLANLFFMFVSEQI